MKIIEQHFEWIIQPENVLETIEKSARTCYKSEEKISAGSANKFVKNLLEKNHHAMIEIAIDPIIKIITNRGVSHELVRHRLCSFAQESTRYINYKKEIEFIKPVWFDSSSNTQQKLWIESCKNSELIYKDLINCGWKPEQARDILPNSIKTEIVIKANLREWRHIFNLRCSKKAHPQIRDIMCAILHEFGEKIPLIFDDLVEKNLPPESINN